MQRNWVSEYFVRGERYDDNTRDGYTGAGESSLLYKDYTRNFVSNFYPVAIYHAKLRIVLSYYRLRLVKLETHRISSSI